MVVKSILAKIVAHKLVVLAAFSVGADLGTSMAFHQRFDSFPARGQTYVGVDGLRRSSPGPAHDILLGHSGPLVMSISIPAPLISTAVLGRKVPKTEKKALAIESLVGLADTTNNVVQWRRYEKWPKPIGTQRTSWR